LILAVVIVGSAAIIAVDRFVNGLNDLAREDMDQAIGHATMALKMLALGIGTGLVAFAAWHLRFCYRVYRTERFPPPGIRIIRDTVVLTGEQARARARLGFLLATIVGAGSVGLAVYLWRVAGLVGGP
jgi:hypothetical protein